jgi:hypothetical protein
MHSLVAVSVMAAVLTCLYDKGVHAGELRVNAEVAPLLLTAQVTEPQLIARVLETLKLAPADLGRLDAAEHAELLDAMRSSEVVLGDRFRLRLLSGFARNRVDSEQTAKLMKEAEAVADALSSNQRHLQDMAEEAGSMSSDTIALVRCPVAPLPTYPQQLILSHSIVLKPSCGAND